MAKGKRNTGRRTASKGTAGRGGRGSCGGVRKRDGSGRGIGNK